MIKRDTCYVAIRKSDNKMVVSTHKTIIGKFIEVSYDTIKRHNKQPIYETKEFILYNNIEVLNKANNVCTNNVIETKQIKRVDNISKYNDLPQEHREDKAKSVIITTIKPKEDFDLF